MDEVWRSFVYREYHDVPRAIAVALEGGLLLMVSAFRDDIDDYDPEYRCYVLPLETDLGGSWIGLEARATQELGAVPVARVRFGAPRKEIELSSLGLDAIGDLLRGEVAPGPVPVLPDDDTGDALRRMVGAGSGLSKPMKMDFMVAVPSEDAGQAVALAASRRGFVTRVEADDGRWTCHCTKTIVPAYAIVTAIPGLLDAIGRQVGGFIDGFGSSGDAGE